MPFKNNKKRQVIAWLVVAAAGIVAGIWQYRTGHEERLDALGADTIRCSLAFQNDDSLERLAGAPEDEGTPSYGRLKRRLERLNEAYPIIQYAGVFRLSPDGGRLACLLDSEPPGGKRALRPGDPFPGAANDDDVMRTLRRGAVTFNESHRVAGRRWISAYAPMHSGDSRMVMRCDADIVMWRVALATKAVLLALYAWMLLGFPLAAYLFAQRYTRQSLSLQKLSVAMEQSATAMMIVDADGRIEYVNSGLCALTYYGRGELAGRNWIAVSGAQPSQEIPKILQLSHEGKTWTEDFELGRKDGSRYPATVTSTPVRGPGGHIIAYIVVITDLTEQQQRAHELRVAKERAESADRAKGVFLATMSHEVRTPLNGIVGFSDLLLDTELTAEQREYVLAIHTSGETLMQLTGEILDYSRIESGRLHLEPDHCDVRSIVEEALDIVAPRATGKSLHLLYSITQDVPPLVTIDGGRLRQVLVNLIGNAIKFTPAGEVEVCVSAVPAETRTGLTESPFPEDNLAGAAAPQPAAEAGEIKLLFSVRDTGIGIAPDNQLRLFKPFVQIDSSNARRYGGAGLGLVISHDLVRMMGGGISVTSDVNKGATFSFFVRCKKPDNANLGSRIPTARLVGKRVAVVADYPGLRRELLRELEWQGASAFAVGLEALATSAWDLAVIDCNENTIAQLRHYMTVPERWRGECTIGLVEIGLESRQRQVLRPFFRALVSKPAHHEILIDKLTRQAGDSGASAVSAGL